MSGVFYVRHEDQRSFTDALNRFVGYRQNFRRRVIFSISGSESDFDEVSDFESFAMIRDFYANASSTRLFIQHRVAVSHPAGGILDTAGGSHLGRRSRTKRSDLHFRNIGDHPEI